MMVDMLAFAPAYLGFFFTMDLRLLRIFRIFRLLKLARYSQALQALLRVFYAERAALFASMILLLSTVCVGGEIMYLTEGALQPDKLGTMPAAMYWAIETLTTVGYGDITPLTPLGKLVAGLTMVVGLGLFALPIGIIANGFIDGLSRRRFAITWGMLREQPLFAGLETSALDDILESANSVILREHRQLTFENSEAQRFYIVVSGKALVEGRDGIRVVGPGALIGGEALEHGGRYGETVIARSDLRAIAIAGEELRWLARKYPLLGERIAAQLPARQTTSQRARIEALEHENDELRRLVADLMLRRDRMSV
jgi:voltage-gated potassium channel